MKQHHFRFVLGISLQWFRKGWLSDFWRSFPALVRARGGSGWMWGRISSLKDWLSTGSGRNHWVLYFITWFNCRIWSRAGLGGFGGLFQPQWLQEVPAEQQLGECWRGHMAQKFGCSLLGGFVTRGVCGVFPWSFALLGFFPPEVCAQCQLDHPNCQIFCMGWESSGKCCPGRIWLLTWPFVLNRIFQFTSKICRYNRRCCLL